MVVKQVLFVNKISIELSGQNRTFVNIGVKIMMQMTQAKKTFNPSLFIILGAVFWLEALLFIRFGGESLFVKGNPLLLLLFVACVPIAWILVKIGAVVGKAEGEDLLSAVTIMSLTALLLDGIALTWCQDWYGLAQSGLLLAAAWLLWGVGVSLAIGYWTSR
jgi:hypothetical protein